MRFSLFPRVSTSFRPHHQAPDGPPRERDRDRGPRGASTSHVDSCVVTLMTSRSRPDPFPPSYLALYPQQSNLHANPHTQAFRPKMVERNPWYTRVQGPFPEQYGCVGVKSDGGGSMRGRGTVGAMKLHRAVFNRDLGLIETLLKDQNADINEVEGAGNTPLHNAAYDGWAEGIEMLVKKGAKVLCLFFFFSF
jgi:hypothetical protein